MLFAVELLVLGLAVNQICEIWHHGEIFSDFREWITAEPDFIGRLTSCMFCMSVWVAAYCVITWFGSPVLDKWLSSLIGNDIFIFSAIFKTPTIVFATSRTAQLINDLTHSWHRTPKE